MADKCAGCGKGFSAGDRIVTFKMERVLKGEKSGILGYYKDNLGVIQGSDGPENIDHIHFTPGCLERTFSPAENPFLFDIIASQIRQEIYEEERDRDPDTVLPEIPALLDDPPYCLWCKKVNTVWVHFSEGYPIYNCLACGKLWDHEEDELYWDPERGSYFLVP